MAMRVPIPGVALILLGINTLIIKSQTSYHTICLALFVISYSVADYLLLIDNQGIAMLRFLILCGMNWVLMQLV